MLGFRELIILVLFIGVPLAISFVIWRSSRRASDSAARLANLDALRASGKITAAEYERQRASIISGA
ncbi:MULTISPECIES: SHOCT domain-containing protein [unclassified Microcoleus]|uniref:SHOCT domain-containing protein n=1 Tax=unclassified Microcoleus TaxID=2642155 RepID=UPI002FD49F1A